MNATEFDYKYDDTSEQDSKRKSKTNEDEAQKSTLETISHQPSTKTPLIKFTGFGMIILRRVYFLL
jgi:hypothetical protein